MNICADAQIFMTAFVPLRGPNCMIPSAFSACIECVAFEITPRVPCADALRHEKEA